MKFFTQIALGVYIGESDFLPSRGSATLVLMLSHDDELGSQMTLRYTHHEGEEIIHGNPAEIVDYMNELRSEIDPTQDWTVEENTEIDKVIDDIKVILGLR